MFICPGLSFLRPGRKPPKTGSSKRSYMTWGIRRAQETLVSGKLCPLSHKTSKCALYRIRYLQEPVLPCILLYRPKPTVTSPQFPPAACMIEKLLGMRDPQHYMFQQSQTLNLIRPLSMKSFTALWKPHETSKPLNLT